jgi:hypothetical protein
MSRHPANNLRWWQNTPFLCGGLGALAAFSLSSPPAWAAGSIDAVVQDASQALGQTPAAVVVVAAPLVSDTPAPRGDDMALRLAALVAGRLGASARAHPQVAGLASARAVAGRAAALVFVQGEVAKGDLRATIDVYPSMANGWDRIRNPLPSPTAHAFATAKVDAEVRAFLAPLVLEQASVHHARHDEGDVLAAACGDIDGDGGDELVLVSRARVAMGRVRGSRFVAERTATWNSLAPRAAVPVREPLASALVTPGAVLVGTTDRAGLTLTPDFAGHSPVLGLPAPSSEGTVCLVPNPSAGAFDGAPVDCAISRDQKPKLAVPAPRFDAFASATIVDGRGAAHPVVAVREPSGKLKVKMGDAVAAPDGTFGAQLAVGDLDQDGVPEVATTVDGADDAVNVFSWPAASTDLRGRLHLAAPAGVRALAVCPPEDGAEPVLVAVVGGELWLVRAGLHGASGSLGEAPATKGEAR